MRDETSSVPPLENRIAEVSSSLDSKIEQVNFSAETESTLRTFQKQMKDNIESGDHGKALDVGLYALDLIEWERLKAISESLSREFDGIVLTSGLEIRRERYLSAVRKAKTEKPNSTQLAMLREEGMNLLLEISRERSSNPN